MNFGEYLKKKRKEKGYTQEKLAELVNVDERTIRRIEKSTHLSETKTLDKICKTLDISTSDIRSIKELNFDKEIDYLNPMRVLNNLFNNNPKDLLIKLEENLLKAFKFAEKEKYQEALDIYLAFSKLLNEEFIYLGCATMYQMLGEYDKSIEFSDKILNMKTYKYEALSTKGVSLGELGNYIDSIEAFKSALMINETDELHLNLGVCYSKVMKFDESIYHLNKAIKLNPNMYQAYSLKGEYYRFIENHDKAIKYFRKCLELHNKNYQALLGISISLAEKENILESAIYFKRLFELYSESFFDINKSSAQKSHLIDIGYEKLRFITFEYESKDIFKVYINKTCIPINMKKDNEFIFIGCCEISDETGSTFYPTVGKIYQDKSEFNEVITQIQNSVQLFQYFDKPIYIDFNKNIKVNIIEQKNNVFIEMIFGNDYRIVGLTDTKSRGFKTFIEQYKKYNQFRIDIICSGKTFIIDGLKNISINLLNN